MMTTEVANISFFQFLSWKKVNIFRQQQFLFNSKLYVRKISENIGIFPEPNNWI
jgi:hypothetical protein